MPSNDAERCCGSSMRRKQAARVGSAGALLAKGMLPLRMPACRLGSASRPSACRSTPREKIRARGALHCRPHHDIIMMSPLFPDRRVTEPSCRVLFAHLDCDRTSAARPMPKRTRYVPPRQRIHFHPSAGEWLKGRCCLGRCQASSRPQARPPAHAPPWVVKLLDDPAQGGVDCRQGRRGLVDEKRASLARYHQGRAEGARRSEPRVSRGPWWTSPEWVSPNL